MTPTKISYHECSCHSSEHTIRFLFDEDEDDLYLEVQLCQTKNFFQRIKAAFKYMFGHQCRYGHWDCVSLDKDTTRDIVILFQEFLDNKKKFS